MNEPRTQDDRHSTGFEVMHADCAQRQATTLPAGSARVFDHCAACKSHFRAGDDIARITFGEDEFDYMHLDCAQTHPMNEENQAAGAQCATEGQIDSTSASSETSR